MKEFKSIRSGLPPLGVPLMVKTADDYGWHISDLVIYNKPKELNEFKKINRKCWYADLGLAKRDCPKCQNANCMITRPPQSWCYCEEVEK